MTGTPPATEAPKSSWQPFSAATANSSGPKRAMSCLFAVTTDFPASSAAFTHERAGSTPPTTSTTTSTSPFSTASTLSVQQTDESTHETRLRWTLRLKTCVSSNPGTFPELRIRATELPTVPNPSRAILREATGATDSEAGGERTTVWLAIVYASATCRDGNPKLSCTMTSGPGTLTGAGNITRCMRRTASSAWLSSTTKLRFISDAPWKIIFTGNPERALSAQAEITGSRATLRPTTETSATPSVTFKLATPSRAFASDSAHCGEVNSNDRFERETAARSTRQSCCSAIAKIEEVNLASSPCFAKTSAKRMPLLHAIERTRGSPLQFTVSTRVPRFSG